MLIVKLFERPKPLATELIVHLLKCDQYLCQQLFLFEPGQRCVALGFSAYIQGFNYEIKGCRRSSVGRVYTATYNEQELVVGEAAIDEDAADFDVFFLSIVALIALVWILGVWSQKALLGAHGKDIGVGKASSVTYRCHLAILSALACLRNPHRSF